MSRTNGSNAEGYEIISTKIHAQPFAKLDLRFRTSHVDEDDRQMAFVLRGVKELLDDAYHLGVNKGKRDEALRASSSTPTLLSESNTFMKDGKYYIRHFVDMRGMDLDSIEVAYSKTEGKLFLRAKFPARVFENHEVNVSI